MRSTLPLFVAALAAAAPAVALETVPVSAFRAVQLRGGGEVTIRPGPVQRVTIVEGSSQFTTFRVERNGQLRINVCNNRARSIIACALRSRARACPTSRSTAAAPFARRAVSRQPIISAPRSMAAGRSTRARLPQPHVSAAVNGGGRIAVHPRRSLNAAVNGGGEVRYLGNPQVSMAVRGGGVVRPGS